MKKLLSWLVLFLCAAGVDFIFGIPNAIRYYGSLFITGSDGFIKIVAISALYITVFALYVVVIYFGSKITYLASEKVLPNKTEVRYYIFSAIWIFYMIWSIFMFLLMLWDHQVFYYFYTDELRLTDQIRLNAVSQNNITELGKYKLYFITMVPMGLYGIALLFWKKHYRKKLSKSPVEHLSEVEQLSE